MSKKKSRKKQNTPSNSKATSSFDTSPWKLSQSPAVRQLPAFSSVEKIYDHLSALPENTLNAGDKFLLGSISVLLGGIRAEDILINQGIRLLESTVGGEKPHPLALIELAWLGAFLESRYIGQEYAKQALTRFPENPDIWKFQALVYLRSRDREKTAECLKKANELQPVNPVLSENFKQIESEEALSLGSGFLFPAPVFGSLHHPPENPEKILYFNQFILSQCLLFQEDNQDLLFESALHSYFLNDLDEAENTVKRILSLNSGHVDGMALCGLILDKKGEFEQAFHLYQVVLKKEPTHPLANTNLARFMQARGVNHTAENLLETALQSAPEYPEALSLAGRVLADREGQLERAMECHRKALQIDPEIPEYHVNFCLTALQVGEFDQLNREWPFHKKYIQAFTKNGAVRKLINLVLAGARDPMQNTALAQLLNENHFKRSARIFLERAWKKRYKVESDKEDDFLYLTGMQASACGYHEISLEAFKQLAERSKKPGPSTVYLALSLSGLGRHEEAIKEIAACDLEDSRVLSVAADIQWDAGRHKDALNSTMEAAEKVDTQFLPIYKGVQYALRCGRHDTSEKFLAIGRKKFPQSTQFLALSAQTLLSSGKTLDAVSLLKERLYKEGAPILLTLPKKEEPHTLEEDLFAPYYMLGCALLQAGESTEFDTYLPWLDKNMPDILGEWETLRAEHLRIKGEFDAALRVLTPANTHPPAQTSRILCLAALGRYEEAASAASRLLARREGSTFWYHPEGHYQALACTVLAEADLVKGDSNAAREHIDRGLSHEPGSSALQKLRKKVAEQSVSG